MISSSELQTTISGLLARVKILCEALAIEDKRKRLLELEEQAQAADFWDDREKAQQQLKKQERLRRVVTSYDKLAAECDEVQEFLQIIEGDDDAMLQELNSKVGALQEQVGALEVQRMFSGESDANNAILTINSGAGGTEAQDWVAMLLRMYMRWCDRQGLKAEIVDTFAGEEAGYKSATVTVEGDYAYGYLKADVGIHRLVRISPFDANARRHTSFASVFVIPEVSDDINVEIRDADLKIDTYRAGGAGGQHVNKTDSAVRITHQPTGIVVQCQNERSQHKNKAMAMKILKSRLYDHELDQRRKEMDKYHSDKKDIAWGSQIRSYVLHPYRMVKDHRTKLEIGNVDAVLDGDITPFMENFLLQQGSANAETAVDRDDIVSSAAEESEKGKD